jgi:hypothetical protein
LIDGEILKNRTERARRRARRRPELRDWDEEHDGDTQ